jgi:transcription antitermination factor NusG
MKPDWATAGANVVRFARAPPGLPVERLENWFSAALASGAIELVAYRASAAPAPPADELVEPAKIEVEGVRWAVAMTRHGRERRVAAELAADGYRTYCPLGRALALRARVKGSSRRERRVRQFPVFPNYVFIGSPPGLAFTAAAHEDVIAALGGASGPQSVPAATVALVNELELLGQWNHAGSWRAKCPLKRGAVVRMTEGAFAGLNATVAALPREMRVVVELALFGRPTRIEVDACAVAPV